MVVDLMCAEDASLPGLVLQGLRLLETMLSAAADRAGSGRVGFDNLKLTWRSRDYYASA